MLIDSLILPKELSWMTVASITSHRYLTDSAECSGSFAVARERTVVQLYGKARPDSPERRLGDTLEYPVTYFERPATLIVETLAMHGYQTGIQARLEMK
jgi:hypothetical protein